MVFLGVLNDPRFFRVAWCCSESFITPLSFSTFFT
jgi:hypothetical protein